MRSPPSPARLPAYPVTGGLGLMASAVTLMTLTGKWSVDRFTVGPTAFRGEPWRIFTSVLPHGDALHLLFNVYWLWVFGTLLEEVLGHVRLLGLCALFAAGSMAAEYAVFSGGIGLSGVGYGLFGLLWVLSARDRRFAGAVDARTAQLFAAWFVLCVVTTVTKVFPVANVAHGVGAALGMLVGAAMSARIPARRVIAAVAVPVVVAASLAGATVLRPRVNLAHDGLASFRLGYDAIQAGRLDEAIRDYKESLAMNDRDAAAWHNLGVAYQSAGRSEEALDAYRKSYEVDRHDAEHRAVYLRAMQRVAAQAAERGDHQRALAVLRDALALDPDEALTWLLLEQSYRALGRSAEADDAAAHAAKLSPKPR